MKQLILTGLAHETDLSDLQNSGAHAIFLLVFNGGELRVPTTQDGAEQVIKYLAGVSSDRSNGHGKIAEAPPVPRTSGPVIAEAPPLPAEADIFSSPPDSEERRQEDPFEVVDEDGVSQA